MLLHCKIWGNKFECWNVFHIKSSKGLDCAKTKFETLTVTVKKIFSPVHSRKELILDLGDFKHTAVFPHDKDTCRQKICTKKLF